MSGKYNICQMCLSRERKLFPLSDLHGILSEINVWEILHIDGDICWECRSVMTKFHKFKQRVCKAQEILLLNVNVESIKSLSDLSQKNLFISFIDPLTQTLCINTELTPIKLEETEVIHSRNEKVTNEIDIKLADNNDDCENDMSSDIDEKPLTCDLNLNIYADVLNTQEKVEEEKVKSKEVVMKKKKTKRKVISKNKQLTKDISGEKFEMVTFTEEEMHRNREEKMNQPNYKKTPYKCNLCVLGFTRKETYDVHVEKKHDEGIGPYSCDVCQTRFNYKLVLNNHRAKHFTLYKCKLCNYETGELFAAINHCNIKHSDDIQGKIHCRHCIYVAETREDLSEHIRTNHTLYCNECGEKFKGKDTLRTHKRRIHQVKRAFICDMCKKTFKTKTRLESHMVSHGSSIAKTLSYCTLCNIQYKNIYVYRNHLKNSKLHCEQTYTCSECNKRFASKVYWKKHYNFYHLHKSQHKCEVCNKLFISEFRLKNHRQLHHGLSRPRNHECNVCGKKFYTTSTLRNHKLTHSEHRSYMCEDCGDTFKQRPALYTHCRLVHKDNKLNNAVS